MQAMQPHQQHQQHCRLSSFVNQTPKPVINEEDSLYQFNSVAWEPTTTRQQQTRQSSIRAKKSNHEGLYDKKKQPALIIEETPKKKRSDAAVIAPDSPRRRSKVDLPKEQKQIAKEIRDFIQKEKSLRPYSHHQSSHQQQHRRDHSSGSNKLRQSSSSSTRKHRPRSKGHVDLSKALAQVPSTPKSTAPRKPRMPVASSPCSARSNRSLPTVRSPGFSSPYSTRSSRTLPTDFTKAATSGTYPDAPPDFLSGAGYESDFVPEGAEDEVFEKDYFSDADISAARRSGLYDSGTIQTNYFSETDNSAAAEEEECLFSDYFSETENAEDDPVSPSGRVGVVGVGVGAKNPAFSWNVFAKSRARRHHRLRVPSPTGDDVTVQEDVSNLLGDSILGRHGAH